jgi:hypothetical protein
MSTCYTDRKAMVRGRDGTIVKTRWYTMVKARWHDGESAMIRWWKRDDAIVKTRFIRFFTIVPSLHRDFTIVPLSFHHRSIIIVSSYHRVFHHRTIAGKEEIKNRDCPNGTPYIASVNMTFTGFNGLLVNNCIIFETENRANGISEIERKADLNS